MSLWCTVMLLAPNAAYYIVARCVHTVVKTACNTYARHIHVRDRAYRYMQLDLDPGLYQHVPCTTTFRQMMPARKYLSYLQLLHNI